MKMEIIGISDSDVLVKMNGSHYVKIPLIGISEEHELIKHAASYRLGLAQGALQGPYVASHSLMIIGDSK